jgi:deoxyribose-phosphate aldolase
MRFLESVGAMNDILKDLNRRFDYAALRSNVDDKAVIALCEEARQYDFFAVCVNPCWVEFARKLLQGSNTRTVATAGFPLGANRTDIKAAEAAKAVTDGATEIDMVANIGLIKSGEIVKVEREIAEVRKSMPFNVILKVIIEAPLLSAGEQSNAVQAVINGGAQFVKTGTGFSGDVTVDQVQTLYKFAGGKIEVKASGGIRTLEQCQKLIEAGVSRLGSSSSVQIMEELKRLKSAQFP